MKTSTKILFAYVAITIAALTGYMLYLHGERIPRDQYYASLSNEPDTCSLTSDQVTILPQDSVPDDRGSLYAGFGYHDNYKLYSLYEKDKEIIATICVSIRSDYQEVGLDNTVLVDENNLKEYPMYGYYPDTLKWRTKLFVEGCKGKNILISLSFPKLKASAKRFSLCQYDWILRVNHDGDSIFKKEPTYIICNAPIKQYMEKQP